MFIFLLLFRYSFFKSIQIGQNREYHSIYEARQIIEDGDTLELDPEVFTDFNVLPQNSITIKGMGPGYSHFNLKDVVITNGKAAFVTTGDDVTFENIEFSWCWVVDGNGAGIRVEGSGFLHVKNCYFHENERALMSGVCPDFQKGCEVLVEYSRIEKTFAHETSLGHGSKFTFQFCSSETSGGDTAGGHTLKSRSEENYILYNQFLDKEGPTSFSVDIPDGGLAVIVGNVLQEGVNSGNSRTLSFAEEHTSNIKQELYVAYNTFVSERNTLSAIGINYGGTPTGLITNNIFINYKDTIDTTASNSVNNLNNYHCNEYSCAPYVSFFDRENYDYRLLADSVAVIDQAIEPTNQELIPIYEYVKEMKRRSRGEHNDMGAFEFQIDYDDDSDDDSDDSSNNSNVGNDVVVGIVLGITIPIFIIVLILAIGLIVLFVVIITFVKIKKSKKTELEEKNFE